MTGHVGRDNQNPAIILIIDTLIYAMITKNLPKLKLILNLSSTLRDVLLRKGVIDQAFNEELEGLPNGERVGNFFQHLQKGDMARYHGFEAAVRECGQGHVLSLLEVENAPKNDVTTSGGTGRQRRSVNKGKGSPAKRKNIGTPRKGKGVKRTSVSDGQGSPKIKNISSPQKGKVVKRTSANESKASTKQKNISSPWKGNGRKRKAGNGTDDIRKIYNTRSKQRKI